MHIPIYTILVGIVFGVEGLVRDHVASGVRSGNGRLLRMFD